MIYGTILKGIGGFYYVSAGEKVYECRARGKFRKQGLKPMVGDVAGITVVNETSLEGAVEEICERKNSLVRPPVANIGYIVIVVAAASPLPDYYMIDKLTVMAEKNGINVVVCVNKTDIASPDTIVDIYKKAGYEVVTVCAETGEGTDSLKKIIKGSVAAFAGNSGVGKSSLLNCFGFDVMTGGVSKIERGRHTTRHVELFCTEDGSYIMDTPGFSILEVNGIEAEDLKEYFREFARFEGQCKFAGCEHYGANSSSCAVVKAAEEGIISPTRLESYQKLYSELKEIKKWEK